MTCVFITGATGVVGSELVPLFLESPETEVRILVRAEDENRLRQRVDDLFAYWQLPPDLEADFRRRLVALPGDVTRPRLGLAGDAWQRLARETTHIVHAAGNVRLNQSIEAARHDAVDSARSVAELAWASRAGGGPAKLDAVSTVGVAGRMQGLIPERPLTEPRAFHNTYEQAKAEAEEFLLGQLDKGLPLTIHRPSMVVGRSDTGRIIRFQVFYYLCDFLSGAKTWGFVPDTGEATLDIIPVDYVARALALASRDPASVGRILHLCSGPEQAIRLTDLRTAVREFAILNGTRLPSLRVVSPSCFRRWVDSLRHVTCGRTQRALRALTFLLAYLDELQHFDVVQTRFYFGDRGFDTSCSAVSLEQLLAYGTPVGGRQVKAMQER